MLTECWRPPSKRAITSNRVRSLTQFLFVLFVCVRGKGGGGKGGERDVERGRGKAFISQHPVLLTSVNRKKPSALFCGSAPSSAILAAHISIYFAHHPPPPPPPEVYCNLQYIFPPLTLWPEQYYNKSPTVQSP